MKCEEMEQAVKGERWGMSGSRHSFWLVHHLSLAHSLAKIGAMSICLLHSWCSKHVCGLNE